MDGEKYGKERRTRRKYRGRGRVRSFRQRRIFDGDAGRTSQRKEGIPNLSKRNPRRRRRRRQRNGRVFRWRTRIPGRLKNELRSLQRKSRRRNRRRGGRRVAWSESQIERGRGERRRAGLRRRRGGLRRRRVYGDTGPLQRKGNRLEKRKRRLWFGRLGARWRRGVTDEDNRKEIREGEWEIQKRRTNKDSERERSEKQSQEINSKERNTSSRNGGREIGWRGTSERRRKGFQRRHRGRWGRRRRRIQELRRRRIYRGQGRKKERKK